MINLWEYFSNVTIHTHSVVSTTVLCGVASTTLDLNAILIYLTTGLIMSVRYILFPGPCNDKPFALLLLSVCFSHLWYVKFQAVKYILQKQCLPKVNYFHFARFEVLTAALLNVQAFLLLGAWFLTFLSNPRTVGLTNPKDEGIMLLLNIRNCLPHDTASHPRRTEFYFQLSECLSSCRQFIVICQIYVHVLYRTDLT